jgi:hypothetical protein
MPATKTKSRASKARKPPAPHGQLRYSNPSGVPNLWTGRSSPVTNRYGTPLAVYRIRAPFVSESCNSGPFYYAAPMIPNTDNSKDSDSECLLMTQEEQISRICEIIASMVPIIPGSVIPEYLGRLSVDEIYYMSRFPVTQRWYQAITSTNPSYWKGDKIIFTQRWLEAIRGSKGENHPVELVSWEDATAFCSKLNALCKETGLTERLPKGLEFALPWVVQWEYASRAGSTSSFGRMANGMGGNPLKMAWFCVNSGYNTHAVGLKEPNAWGLHDMHGNVWEWCENGGGQERVYCGGSYDSDVGSITSFSRHWDDKTRRHTRIGFRLSLRRL